MTKEHSKYRHPKHDEIAEMLHAGAGDRATAERLEVNYRTVVRVRDIIGLPRRTNSTSKEDKLAKFSKQAGEHTGWTGRRTREGKPSLRHLNAVVPASHVAFEMRTGRQPVGIVMAECGFQHCLTPAHVTDEIERRTIRMQERALYGLDPQPWTVCPKGLHQWAEDGRLRTDLEPYCKSCHRTTLQAVRDARKATQDDDFVRAVEDVHPVGGVL